MESVRSLLTANRTMIVTLELKPEIEARLIAEAAEQGISIKTYLESLIETNLVDRPEKIVAEDWLHLLDRLGKSPSLAKATPLSDEVISRESIYRDREDSQL